eukprot:UN17760
MNPLEEAQFSHTNQNRISPHAPWNAFITIFFQPTNTFTKRLRTLNIYFLLSILQLHTSRQSLWGLV